MEVKLDKINVPDKIQLHKQLKHEKVENKANLIQIKKLQGYVVILGIESGNMQETNKLLEEKDTTIKVLKKKLKVPNAEHVESSKLFTLQEEKEKFIKK